MSRPLRVLLISVAAIAVSGLAAACGTQNINVPNGASNMLQGEIHAGALVFQQRCGGCHTLSYAATHGSASNVRTAQANSGPNFDVRCERPVTRVLYAIENGGFSGAVMPQNVVVGKQAIEVAEFVAKYAGRQAPPSNSPNFVPCIAKPIGALPPASQALLAAGP